MKKVILIALFLLLAGCTNKIDYVNEVDVDVLVNVMHMIEIEENTLTFETLRLEHVEETFQITQIEMLDTGWAEFPYESHFIDEKDWGKYVSLLNDLFVEISQNDTLGGSMYQRLGPKAKLIITLQSDNFLIECGFFQDSNEEISMMEINVSNSIDINEHNYYREDYNTFYARLNEIIDSK